MRRSDVPNRRRVRRASVALTGVAALTLAGCAVVDAVIWGPEGSRVIATTEQLIAGASGADATDLTCDDFVGDLGEPDAWSGLSAGEPEAFDAEASVDRPNLDATWRINLEGMGSGMSPTDVFYRETGDSLCVADVIWQAPIG